MPASVLTLVIALILVAIAWKVFTGVVKTLALLAILVVAAVFVFGGFA